jgi:hypothetical protein
MPRRKVTIGRSSHGLWAVQHLDKRWTLEAHLVRQADALIIGEIRVVPRSKGLHIPGAAPKAAPPAGVPATLVRGIVLGEILREVRRQFNHLATWRDAEQVEAARAIWLAGAEAVPGHPGRPRRDERSFANIAAVYVDLVEGGNLQPIAELADKLGVEKGTASQLVHECRSRKLLSAAPHEPGVQPGRAGGELTAKAKRLLHPKRSTKGDKR